MRRGFSLVELSIVLVILGLLVGGVLSGQSLIRASELRAVVNEEGRYYTAVKSFRDKYFALPGDMTNATSFWGYMGGTGCTNNAGTATIATGTCDGNGDGYLDQAGAIYQSGEAYQFWRQLAQAGMIEGSYSGVIMIVPAWNSGDYSGTNNSPTSRLSNARWGNALIDNTSGSNTQTFAINYRNWFLFFTAGVWPGYALKPSEAWNIDQKMDDGLPGQGGVQAYVWQVCTDAAGSGSTNAKYALTTDAIDCMLSFRL